MCNCYVRFLSEEIRFGLHFGAHNPTCPAYRVSLDPVDRANDDEFRAHTEIPAPATRSFNHRHDKAGRCLPL
jgi:hypothetical protein